MFGFAWLPLRQAQDALMDGRLEDALRLLSGPTAQAQRGAGALLVKLARAFVERGERALQRGDRDAAWRDLLQAEQLRTAERSTERLREVLVQQGLAEVREILQAGEPARAGEALTQLRLHGARSTELDRLEEAAREWQSARDLAGRGDFSRALEIVEHLRRLLPVGTASLDRFATELESRQRSFGPLLARLHAAMESGAWSEVIELAEQVLAVAPRHAEARKARTRAWQAVQPTTIVSAPVPTPKTGPVEASPRFMLWIDGVGGYLVCLGNRLTLGQAAQPGIDVPLVADVSRLHATLTRDAEGYVLETVRPVLVNGERVTRALLRRNDCIVLGATCELRFRQPVPISASAVLDIVSGHRLARSVEGVLLLAETLILGDETAAHVCIPGLTKPVILYRQNDGLRLRHDGIVSVNGERMTDRCALTTPAQVAGEDFSFALEAVGSRL